MIDLENLEEARNWFHNEINRLVAVRGSLIPSSIDRIKSIIEAHGFETFWDNIEGRHDVRIPEPPNILRGLSAGSIAIDDGVWDIGAHEFQPLELPPAGNTYIDCELKSDDKWDALVERMGDV